MADGTKKAIVGSEDGQWITINGKHVFIEGATSIKDATVKYYKNVAKDNEDAKEKQIANVKKYASKDSEVIKHPHPSEEKDYSKKNAEALGLDYDKIKADTVKEYKAKVSELAKLQAKPKKTDDDYNKIKELSNWIARKKKFAEKK